jgi:hypothetical protein
VDDCSCAVQGHSKHQLHVKRVLQESLDYVLRPLDKQDGSHRQERASVKKMLNGDTAWSTRKVVLSWMVDTIDMTIYLIAHRVLRLL